MAEPVMTEQPDVSALTGSPGQKRKREVDSPNLSRNKRTVPASHMSTNDAATAFLESALETTQAAANGVSVADFNALQQATADHLEHPEHPEPHHEHHEHHDHHDHHDHHEHHEHHDPSNATNTAQAALSMYPTLHVPPSTEEQFAAQAAEEHGHAHENAFTTEVPPPDGLMDAPPPHVTPPQQTAPPPTNGVPPPGPPRYTTTTPNPKPTVGSEEWHKMRKDNHKEVERRRRETINEGINELAKIVPGCEKNKGSILQRAVSFISQLKENEQQNIEKWTLEKLLTEQAITELSASNDKLKQECERLYRELETWKRVAQNAGLEPPQPKDEPSTTSTSS